MERGPIFIGGLDRSGKTPLRLMLTSHPHIAMSRRTYMWTRFYNRFGDLSQPDNFERCLTAMLRHKPMRVLKPEPERIRREFQEAEPTYGRLFALFYRHYAERLGKPRWGDQLGMIERYAEPVFAAYPNAKMIHMIRDPRERYEASMTPAQHRRGKVGRDTARWLYSVGLAACNQERYPEGYKIVRYEALNAQPEETLREICAFVGEEFVPGMLTLENALRYEHEEGDEAGDELELDSPRQSSGKVMSKRELAFMQTYARRDLAAHNYPLEPIQLSLSDRLLFYLVDWPANRAGMIAWHALEAKQSG
jgi:hypothetical protein